MATRASGDPLAWPGGLGFRLGLLLALVALTTLLLGGTLSGATTTPTAADNPLREVLACLLAGLEEQAAVLQSGDPALVERALDEAIERVAGCGTYDTLGLLSNAPFILLGLVVLLSLVILLLFPTLIERREGGPRLIADVPLELTAFAEEEIERQGLGGRVAVRWKLGDPRPHARVYGRSGAYRLLLGGGILGLSISAPARARAIVRHELAHIAHGDVDVYFTAQAVWWAYLLGAVLPIVLATPWIPRAGPLDAQTIVLFAAQYGALILIPYVARNLLLHEIEHRADVASAGAPEAAPNLAAVGRRGWDTLRPHPTDGRRRDVIAQPMELLRVRLLEFFLVGTMVGLTPQLVIVGFLAFLWTSPAGLVLAFILMLLPPVIATGLFAGILGYLLQRDAAYARLVGAPPRSPVTLAFASTLGIGCGLALSPFGWLIFVGTTGMGLPPELDVFVHLDATTRLALIMALVAFLVATLALGTGWAGATADAWNARLFATPRPKRLVRRVTIAIALTLALPIAYAYALLVIVPLGKLHPEAGWNLAGDVQAALIVFTNPLSLVNLLLLAGLPLWAARRLPKEAGSVVEGRSPLLGPGSTVLVADPRPSWTIVTLAAVAFTAIGWGLFLTAPGLRLLIAAGVPAAEVGAFVIRVAPFAMAIAAFAAAAIVPRLRWTHAAAVCAAGSLLLAGIVYPLATGGFSSFHLFERILHVNYVGWGGLLIASPGLALLTLLLPRRAPSLVVFRPPRAEWPAVTTSPSNGSREVEIDEPSRRDL